jgi:hypothetical protein
MDLVSLLRLLLMNVMFEAPEIENTLKMFGMQGVLALRTDVQKVSATGKTIDSIRFEVSKDAIGNLSLTFYGRAYFKALETGRGPRKNSEYKEYDLSMYDYMLARGIGADLPEKKRKQLARFLTYKINEEGDSVFKKGGRIVYSPTITKLADEVKRAITRDFVKLYIREILKS